MLSIFVEANCNRYNRDECVHCHVYEPLSHFSRSNWHLLPAQAQVMAGKISQVQVLHTLALQEINLTGGEATQNPHIVEIFKIFKAVSPRVCMHTNLEINHEESKRWKCIEEIVKLGGRVDITLYPTAWECFQKPRLQRLMKIQNRLLVNVVFENLPDLGRQVHLLVDFFEEAGPDYGHVVELLNNYHGKISYLLTHQPDCNEAVYLAQMGDTQMFVENPAFIFGINLLPAFRVDPEGRRSMQSIAFPRQNYLIHCPAARGKIEIMTVQQSGDMIPCCDVGNLKCAARFGNLLEDDAETIMEKMEASSRLIHKGTLKNKENLNSGRGGIWVEEGIPPYCQ